MCGWSRNWRNATACRCAPERDELLNVRAGTDGWTTRIAAPVATRDTGTKSRSGSYGSFSLVSVFATDWCQLSSSVCPSGRAFATRSEAMVVPPPGRLSTTTATPRSFGSSAASTRAVVSAEPPGA
jgi:hypothetical protein